MTNNDEQFTSYYFIYNDIKKKILDNVYKIGDKLPSVVDLCRMYSASDSTIRKSLDMLKKEGYVASSKRVGIFVSEVFAKNFKMRFHELKNLKTTIEHSEILSIKKSPFNDRFKKLVGKNGNHIELIRMFYTESLPIVYKVDNLFINVKFDMEKSNKEKWIKEIDAILDSFFVKKVITIQMDNGNNKIKDLMYIPDNFGLFKIEKLYYAGNGCLSAVSDIYVAGSDLKLNLKKI